MARKKSAAKKAREEAEKLALAEAPKDQTVEESTEVAKKVEDSPEDVSQDEEEESSDESEDEFGDLLTEDVEDGISKVLNTIRSDPKKLLDPEAKFFEDPEKINYDNGVRKEKPLYLQEYQRNQLLSKSYQDEDEEENEYGTVDGEKPFVVQEREERDQLLEDIKKAFEDDVEEDDDQDDDDDGFLKKKDTRRVVVQEEESNVLPDPENNEEEFLRAFIDNRAWIPKKSDKTVNLDKIERKAEGEFEEAVEQFEHVYNFRYEDPTAAEIVSYARNQATLRRSATSARQRQRERKKEEKLKQKQEKEELLKQKKNSKINKVMDRLEKIKQAVGEEVSDDLIQKVFGNTLLQDDFDDADWDNKMAEIFNEQYNGDEGDDTQKPEWDEDDDIMGDFYAEKKNKQEDGDDEEENDDEEETKTSKKDKLKKKKSAKKEKQSLREKAQQIVDAKTHLIVDEIEEERGRPEDNDGVAYKYREVSPDSFGLTTRDILIADDTQLNTFLNLKKLAPYRPKEDMLKDKRKYTKKKRLQQWRREVFNDKNGPTTPQDDRFDIYIPAEQPKQKKRRTDN
ncbi:KRI1-like family C-terminal-domain-containing protein [Scheffersomyces coipomensis]|uniref:KRI1-like family C-terminal-domain-containing protein n=1 Tax=Scheffersomyces coipomensis TaxID=1788519 RepID=UPI00315DD9BC